jgi:hypothetical protein
VFSTYLGGSHQEEVSAISLDDFDNVYVGGSTYSSNFPVTSNAYQTNNRGDYDAFITKLSADGSSLVFSTYLGGSDQERAFGLALDSNSAVYVCGQTGPDFPITQDAIQAWAGRSDAFVARLSPDGTSLTFSTFLGGSGNDIAWDIGVDNLGSMYVAGKTSSPDFPTHTACQDSLGSPEEDDAFVAKIAYVTVVGIDIKPGTCSNELELEVKKEDVLRIAILGSEDLSAEDIDLSSIQLSRACHQDGFVPISYKYKDLATPSDGELYDCDKLRRDGLDDLIFKFDVQTIVNALGPVDDGDKLELKITGKLTDDTPFEGTDYIVISDKGKGKPE